MVALLYATQLRTFIPIAPMGIKVLDLVAMRI